MTELRVGVLGASSVVGRCVLRQLLDAGWQVTPYSRQVQRHDEFGVNWFVLPIDDSVRPASSDGTRSTPYWICLAPIWVLPDYFALLETSGVRRLVALSSTSRFTKSASGEPAESAVAAKLLESEARVQSWAEERGIEWVVLRPTLIYGFGEDKNVAEIARFIRRFGFFPLLGHAEGRRQPIHASDVAAVCVAALRASNAANRAYNISGGETLSYRDMVGRVFVALGRTPRFVTVPMWAFRWAVAMARILPRYRHWSFAMVTRMNRDLMFDHAEAARDLGFTPREFSLSKVDLS